MVLRQVRDCKDDPLFHFPVQIFQEPKKANQVEQVLTEFSRCIQVLW